MKNQRKSLSSSETLELAQRANREVTCARKRGDRSQTPIYTKLSSGYEPGSSVKTPLALVSPEPKS